MFNRVDHNLQQEPHSIRPHTQHEISKGGVALTSKTQNNKQPNLLPQRSTYTPKKVPKTAEDKKPVKNNLPTSTPYDCQHIQHSNSNTETVIQSQSVIQ